MDVTVNYKDGSSYINKNVWLMDWDENTFVRMLIGDNRTLLIDCDEIEDFNIV